MFNFLEFEGKTLDEAKEKALKNLNCNEDELFYKEQFIEGKLFKSSKYVIYATKIDDIKEYIKEFFKSLANLMGFDIQLEMRREENIINITLISDNNSILIGKEGRTIDALQNIIRQKIKNQLELDIKVNIDVSNYKLNKLKNIEHEIKKIAEEVLISKIDTALDPMNSYERRMVHNVIGKYENLTSESYGEGKERHIVIKYVEK